MKLSIILLVMNILLNNSALAAVAISDDKATVSQLPVNNDIAMTEKSPVNIAENAPVIAAEAVVLTEAEQVQLLVDKGLKAYHNFDMIGAMNLFEEAANKNHPYATAMIGYVYLRADDSEQAVRYFQTAVELNDAFAQLHLSNLYAVGNGVEKDDKKAFSLLEKSAEQKNAQAYFLMGAAYEHGRLALTVDSIKALEYYQAAMALENRASLQRMIKAYRNGELNLPIDDIKSKELRTHLNSLPKIIELP